MAVRLLGVQIANGFSPEGRIFAGLISRVDPAQVQACVLHHDWPGDRGGTRFREVTGVPVTTMDFGWRSVARGRGLAQRARTRLQFRSSLPRALAIARRAGPDVIYSSQQLWDCQAATYIARRLNKPQVIHLHYTVGPWLHPPVLRRLLTCDHVITVSNFIREEALRHGVAPERVTAIRNTMAVPPPPAPGTREAVRHELGIAPGVPVLGIVARLDPDKGQADTFQALAKIRASYPEARLLVIGQETPWHPGYAEELKATVARLGLSDRVLFLGQRSDVPRLLAAMDVFVHPSRMDPCPQALLEGSAAGLPVVAYAEGGAIEMVEDGTTGLLAAPGDTDALAACVRNLLADPRLAREMGSAGRKRVEVCTSPAGAVEAFVRVLRGLGRVPVTA